MPGRCAHDRVGPSLRRGRTSAAGSDVRWPCLRSGQRRPRQVPRGDGFACPPETSKARANAKRLVPLRARLELASFLRRVAKNDETRHVRLRCRPAHRAITARGASRHAGVQRRIRPGATPRAPPSEGGDPCNRGSSGGGPSGRSSPLSAPRSRRPPRCPSSMGMAGAGSPACTAKAQPKSTATPCSTRRSGTGTSIRGYRPVRVPRGVGRGPAGSRPLQ